VVAPIYHPLSLGGQGQDGRELFFAILHIDACFFTDVDLDDQVDENLVRMERRCAFKATTTRPSSTIPLFGPPPPHLSHLPLVVLPPQPLRPQQLRKRSHRFFLSSGVEMDGLERRWARTRQDASLLQAYYDETHPRCHHPRHRRILPKSSSSLHHSARPDFGLEEHGTCYCP
jgi:hypothetical protein